MNLCRCVMSKIVIDYNVLDEEGKNIIKYAEEYNNIINLFKSTMDKMNEDYVSNNANYLNECMKKNYNNFQKEQAFIEKLGELMVYAKDDYKGEQQNFVKETDKKFNNTELLSNEVYDE